MVRVSQHIGRIFPHEAQCPVVDEVGGRLRVYYGARDEQNRSRIYYFEAMKDNLFNILHTNIPIVRLGGEGTFDCDGQIPSSIGVVNGVKWLYFTGVRKGGENRYENSIGAIRMEEEGFFKLKEPVMERMENEWFNSHLMINGNNGYFCSCREWRNNEPLYDIHMAKTTDGIEWERKTSVMRLRNGEGGICGMNVSEASALFCVRDKEDYRGGAGSYRLETAEWSIGGWERTGRLEIQRSVWDSDMQCYPYIYKNYLFYNGNQFGKTGIGVCVLE